MIHVAIWAPLLLTWVLAMSRIRRGLRLFWRSLVWDERAVVWVEKREGYMSQTWPKVKP